MLFICQSILCGSSFVEEPTNTKPILSVTGSSDQSRCPSSTSLTYDESVRSNCEKIEAQLMAEDHLELQPIAEYDLTQILQHMQ